MSLIEWRYLWLMNYSLNKDRVEATVKKLYFPRVYDPSFIRKIKAPLCSHHTGGIRKRSFISTVSFQRPMEAEKRDPGNEVGLGLPSTLIGDENRAFRKRCLNPKNLKIWAFRFCADGKHFIV